MSLVLIDGVSDGVGVAPSKWSVNNANIGGGTILGTSAWALQNGTTLTKTLTPAEESATIGVGCYFKSTDINQQFLLLGGDNGATWHITFTHLQTTGQIEVRRGSGGTLLGTTAPFLMPRAIATHVEVRVVLHDTAGEVQVWINNGLALNLTGIDTKNGGTDAVFDTITFFQNGGYSIEGLIGHLFIWVDDGVDPQDRIGEHRTITSYPTAEGTTNQWTGSDGNDVDNHLLVDEAGAPNTADYVLDDVDGQIELYAMGDLPSTDYEIAAVQLLLHGAKSDAGAASLRRVLRSGGSNFNGADVALATAHATVSGEILTLDPATSAAWTPTNFNALELGAEKRP